jgi:hypothetical protein
LTKECVILVVEKFARTIIIRFFLKLLIILILNLRKIFIVRIFVKTVTGTFIITMCSFPHSWLITRFVTRHVPIMERGLYLFGVPEFNPVFCGVQDCSVDTSFLCRFFCRSLFVLISFGQCICPSIYGFWLTLWYLQTFRITHILWKYN